MTNATDYQRDYEAMRIIESLYAVEDGIAWVPAGRSGWKIKRIVKVPMRGGYQIGPDTIVMHPATAAIARGIIGCQTPALGCRIEHA